MNLYVEDEFDRASYGGTGGVKTISNYAPVSEPFTYLALEEATHNFYRKPFTSVGIMDFADRC